VTFILLDKDAQSDAVDFIYRGENDFRVGMMARIPNPWPPAYDRRSPSSVRWCLSGSASALRRNCLTRAAGIEATAISGHSTRIGKAQDCVAAGIGIGAIMRDGGRRSGKKAAHC